MCVASSGAWQARGHRLRPRGTPARTPARTLKAHAHAHGPAPPTPTPTYFGDAGGDDGPVRLKVFLPLPPDRLARLGSDFFGCLADLESPMVVPRANADYNDSQVDFGRSTKSRLRVQALRR